MEGASNLKDGVLDSSDVEEEYRSWCTEDEEWKDTEESLANGVDECLDEFSVRMYFKGVSVAKDGGSGHRVSGIGVVMERQKGVDVLQVQKKLDFFVEESVAEHLALMDGLLAALRKGVRRVFVYTDSEEVYEQIADTEERENAILVALGQRIMEHVDNLETVLKLVLIFELHRPLRLAQEAIGQLPVDGSFKECPMCCEGKEQLEMIKLTCSHRFCVYQGQNIDFTGSYKVSRVKMQVPHLGQRA